MAEAVEEVAMRAIGRECPAAGILIQAVKTFAHGCTVLPLRALVQIRDAAVVL